MTHLTGALAPAITEPLSKCQLLSLIGETAAKAERTSEALRLALLRADLTLESDRRLEVAEAECADAHQLLCALIRQAVDTGLMAELKGYLTATYGG